MVRRPQGAICEQVPERQLISRSALRGICFGGPICRNQGSWAGMSAGVGIELQNLTVSFGDFVAVRDATVTIEGGEFFSFLGPSGCGKTTILRTVSGFLEPTGGRVRIGGNDMAGIGPNKRPTALIFQNLALFPLMRVWENIAFALEVQGERQGRAAPPRRRAARADRSAGPGRQAASASCPAARSSGSRLPARSVSSRGAAARRAAVRARPQAAPAHAQRAARHPAARRHHLHLHHPRSGRGADHVRPRRGDARRA